MASARGFKFLQLTFIKSTEPFTIIAFIFYPIYEEIPLNKIKN